MKESKQSKLSKHFFKLDVKLRLSAYNQEYLNYSQI